MLKRNLVHGFLFFYRKIDNILREQHLTIRGAPNVHWWYTKSSKLQKTSDQDSPQEDLSIHILRLYKKSRFSN